MRIYTKVLQNRHTLSVMVLVPGDDGVDRFSVTAEERNSRKRIVACGCMHDEILQHFPELADIVALHLSDIDGIPMYAEENGWYWLAGACGGFDERHGVADKPEDCRRILAQHLRILAAEVSDLIGTTLLITNRGDIEPARVKFKQFVENLKPRWADEAYSGINKYRAT